jgi:hypothetical protein
VVRSKYKNGAVRVRDDETGIFFDVQDWMLDPVFCKEIREVEKPYASVEALLDLAGIMVRQQNAVRSKMDIVQEGKERIDEQTTDAPSHGEEPSRGRRGICRESFADSSACTP